jgi:hypothetical protein
LLYPPDADGSHGTSDIGCDSCIVDQPV